MNDYTARIELHDATWEHYEALHAAMERIGFYRMIRGDSGVLYDLPTGVYHCKGSTVELEPMRDLLVRTGNAIRPNPWVLLSQVIASAWKLHVSS